MKIQTNKELRIKYLNKLIAVYNKIRNEYKKRGKFTKNAA